MFIFRRKFCICFYTPVLRSLDIYLRKVQKIQNFCICKTLDLLIDHVQHFEDMGDGTLVKYIYIYIFHIYMKWNGL